MSLLSDFILILFFSYFSGGLLQFFTRNDYEYLPLFDAGLSFVENSSIVFEVKTCRGAHIALMSEKTDTGPLYEVVIGGEKKYKNDYAQRKVFFSGTVGMGTVAGRLLLL